MSTIKALADALGVTEKTVRNSKKDGYAIVLVGSKDVDVELSVHSYVKFQSEKIRKMNALVGRKLSGNSGNSNDENCDPDDDTDWKMEKEKEGAIKLITEPKRPRGTGASRCNDGVI